MKTVTTTLRDLINNFNATMVDSVLDGRGEEGYSDVACYLMDLKGLLSSSPTQVAATVRRLFSQGFTMMLLSPVEFEYMDAANMADEDFCLVVKDNGETLCILAKNELSW